jgi:hypothetical protein
MSRIIFLFFVSLSFFFGATAQKIESLTAGTKTSIRGMSVVNEKLLWVSGSNGTVGRSADGGKTWKWTVVPGYEKREFRDIEAFDDKTAVIIAIAEPANILKTTDGGLTWKTVFTDTTKGMFLDAMDFVDKKMGIVVGDPIDDIVFLATTNDGGDHWQKYSGKKIPVTKGEAFFASSGTNILYNKDGSFEIVSGGTASRIISSVNATTLPIIQGKESTGANSIAGYKSHIAIVGGDFGNEKDTTANCFISESSTTQTWIRPATPPHGYRSCVEYITEARMITCGTSGVDISEDGGKNWKLISTEGFHVVQKAKKGNAVFLAGGGGRIAKLVW